MIRKLLIGICVFALVACGGGGGGRSTPQVDPGPPPSGGNVPAPDPVPPDTPEPDFATADRLIAVITDVTIDSAPVVDFTVTDGQGVAITDLTAGNVRFTLAKLVPGTGGSPSRWQSYINQTETSNVNPENEPATQATADRGGELVNHQDGTYTYTFVTDIANVTDPVPVEFEPNLTHRVAIQFSGGPPVNPTFDWVPATGAEQGIESRDVVTTESCNTCHDKLALHGGGRIETDYCVTCHNPGSADADSGNTVDFKVMIHKLHRGANLPSVQAGGEYVIYGFRDSRHDFSDLIYPQDIRNCTKCHAGTGTDPGEGTVVLTSDGDNWNEVPNRAACGSCHDDVNFVTGDGHAGGPQEDDSACLSCHADTGFVGSVASSHETIVEDAIANFSINVLDVTNTAPGQQPVVTFSVTNPADGSFFDIVNDLNRLRMAVAWDTDDYTNEGDGGETAAYELTDARANAMANGDGTYTVTSETRIPDPFIKDSGGSGSIIFEGQGLVDVSGDGSEFEIVPLTFGIKHFSINEPDGVADPRRQSVTIEQCNVCHGVKRQHGDNRANETQGCIGCHNPRLTDKSVREIANNPPTDGKDEESIHFKRLIHGIHASAFRENPLQVVGFRGFNTHVFDEEEVRFPGRLANCRTCHVEGAWRLPLPDGVLASTIDTGDDLADPSDDVMITPVAATCSSCHDSSVARSHMQQNGGDFSATQASIRSGASTEACTVCHGPGRIADLDEVHGLD